MSAAVAASCDSRVRAARGLRWLEPVWPVAARVRVVSTLRSGGVSVGPWASLNLAQHVGDDAGAVVENRRRLRESIGVPVEPSWLSQVHGAAVVEAARVAAEGATADASVAFLPGTVCAVMTADCLPVVLAERGGHRVGIAHAGWRGLAAGVIENTIAALGCAPGRLVAWLGPAISQASFEVGPEVREAFVAKDPEMSGAFVRNAHDRFQADLYELARLALRRSGVVAIHGGGWCTMAQRGLFYSFRRDGRTGRMATLAWLDDGA